MCYQIHLTSEQKFKINGKEIPLKCQFYLDSDSWRKCVFLSLNQEEMMDKMSRLLMLPDCNAAN